MDTQVNYQIFLVNSLISLSLEIIVLSKGSGQYESKDISSSFNLFDDFGL
jgi:hypothetical protein